MKGGKRELLARGLLCSGATLAARLVPPRDSLLVLNYHRIGNDEQDPYDPGVFSATADELDAQINFLKREVALITIEEALEFVEGKPGHSRRPRCRALITFDDGYLDNYQLAFPLLRSHGVQGVFFLTTANVGSCHVPWWDHIAFVLKSARRRKFDLRYPVPCPVDLDAMGLRESLRRILNLYKRPDNTDADRFVRALEDAARGDRPPEALRRFLDWKEAREMLAGGMAIGSHAHSHHVLSQLPAPQQAQELAESRRVLREQLGIAADALAYPVGATDSFTGETMSAAEQAGYRMAFSFHGGANWAGQIRRFDVKRQSVDGPSLARFRVQVSLSRALGSYWP